MLVSEPRRQVEVLIASYNTCELLRDCLASLADNAPENGQLEVRAAVFDNGSTDGSADMVAAEFPSCRLVRSPTNVGFARANNALAETSTADYLMLLNSDTLLRMDPVSPLVAELESEPEIAVVGPRLLSANGATQPSSQRFPTLRFELAILFGIRLTRLVPSLAGRLGVDEALGSVGRSELESGQRHDAEHLWATCWLMRREEVARSGLFASEFVTYDEDLDYCKRLHRSGRRLVWVPEVHVVHLGSKSTTLATRRRLQEHGRRQYYRRHHGRLTATAFASMVAAAKAIRRLKPVLASVRRAASALRRAGDRVPRPY
jgi:hypothetical protein